MPRNQGHQSQFAVFMAGLALGDKGSRVVGSPDQFAFGLLSVFLTELSEFLAVGSVEQELNRVLGADLFMEHEDDPTALEAALFAEARQRLEQGDVDGAWKTLLAYNPG